MSTNTRNWIGAGVIVVLVLALGGYLLAQHRAAPAPLEENPMASSTGAATSSPIAPGLSGAPDFSMGLGSPAAHVSNVSVTQTPPAPTRSPDFRVAVTGTATVGSSLPVSTTLPGASNGKTLVFLLHPAAASGTSGVLFAFSLPSGLSGTTFPLQGVTLSEVTNPSTGVTTAIAPGAYTLEARLYDRSPFAGGSLKYGSDLNIPSLTATSESFTVR